MKVYLVEAGNVTIGIFSSKPMTIHTIQKLQDNPRFESYDFTYQEIELDKIIFNFFEEDKWQVV